MRTRSASSCSLRWQMWEGGGLGVVGGGAAPAAVYGLSISSGQCASSSVAWAPPLPSPTLPAPLPWRCRDGGCSRAAGRTLCASARRTRRQRAWSCQERLQSRWSSQSARGAAPRAGASGGRSTTCLRAHGGGAGRELGAGRRAAQRPDTQMRALEDFCEEFARNMKTYKTSVMLNLVGMGGRNNVRKRATSDDRNKKKRV